MATDFLCGARALGSPEEHLEEAREEMVDEGAEETETTHDEMEE